MVDNVLIINPFGLGDVIFSMTLVEALKKQLPRVRIGFLGNERTVPLLRMNASIDVSHEFNRDELRALRQKDLAGYLKRLLKYVGELKHSRYDTVFDLSLGREFSFAAFLSGIPRRVGFDYKGRGFFLTHRVPFTGYEGMPVSDRQLSLLTVIGLDALPVSSRLPLKVSGKAEEKASGILARDGRTPSQKIFAVAPGGGRSWGPNAIYKQWPAERFAHVVNRLSRQGDTVLLLGDGEEKRLLLQVEKALSVPVVTVSGESLEVVASLLKRSQLLLCNDGGLLHLANALGVKTAAIFGPVDETAYGVCGHDTPHETLVQPVPCRPCYKQFRFPPCAHERRCMEELTMEKVLAAAQKIS